MPTDILNARFRNQAGILDVSLYNYLDLAIVGVGSIGSFLALSLNKLGFENIVVIDHDRVEEHNVPTQIYSNSHIGKHKTIALVELLTGNISSYIGKVTPTNKINTDIVFVCVDSLSQRKNILKSVLESNKKYGVPKLLIDGRMHRLVFEVYTIVLDDEESLKGYKESLNQEGYGGACTEKGIIQNTLAVTAVMIEQLRKVLEGDKYSEVIISDFERFKFISSNISSKRKGKNK